MKCWVPTKGWKETTTWPRNFRFSVKSIPTWSHLKSENVNMENEGTAGKKFGTFEILHFKMGKWEENELTSPKEIHPP